MASFARITRLHHLAVANCSPCARLMYEYLLMGRPAGTPIEFIIEDFQAYTAQFRKRGGFCQLWVKKALKELLDIDLVQVVRKLGAHAFKLVAFHPPDTFENKSFEKPTQTLNPPTKTSKKGASNPDAAVPTYKDIEQHSHPSHPPVDAQKVKLDPEVATENSLASARVTEVVTPEIVSPVADNPPPPTTNKCDEESAALVAEARELIAPIPLNPQLQKLVVEAAASVVKAALQAVREQKAKGGVRNVPGLLVIAIRQQWVPTEAPYTGNQLPQELLDWYPSAIAAGFVQDLPIRWLPTVMGEVQVRVDDPSGRQPYVLESWRQVKAMMDAS